MEANIISIAAGKTRTYSKGGEEFQSAYKKDLFFNFIDVTDLGITEDEQLDKRFHGGVDKALHIGSSIHFEKFRTLHDKEMDTLGIGCNIIIDTIDEKDICIGDIYTIGDVEIEVSQPRQPCWKIGALFGKDISRYIIKSRATGWYARILMEGTLDKNDKMVLKKRVSDITIDDLNRYLHNPPADKKFIQTLLELPFLAKAYKDDLKNAVNKFSS